MLFSSKRSRGGRAWSEHWIEAKRIAPVSKWFSHGQELESFRYVSYEKDQKSPHNINATFLRNLYSLLYRVCVHWTEFESFRDWIRPNSQAKGPAAYGCRRARREWCASGEEDLASLTNGKSMEAAEALSSPTVFDPRTWMLIASCFSTCLQ